MTIQFKAIRVTDGKTPDDTLAQQLTLWSMIFDTLWMAPYVEGKGSAGNMGFRCDNGICLTPSGCQLGKLRQKDIMTVTDVQEEGEAAFVYYYGHPEKKPTSECLIYWDIFSKREDIQVILHGHDLLALEKTDELLQKFQAEIVITPSVTDAGSKEFRKEILGCLSGNVSYIIGKGHGFFALGNTFEEAGKISIKYRTEALKLFLGEQILQKIKNKYEIV